MALTPGQIRDAQARLPGVVSQIPGCRLGRNGQASKGKCPLCGQPALGLRVGNDHPLIWGCLRDRDDPCPPITIRDRLTRDYGISEQLLGSYLATSPPARTAPYIDYRAECDRLRAELALSRAQAGRLEAVLADPDITKITELRMRIRGAVDGEEMPVSYREFIELGRRAGCKSTQVKDLFYRSVGWGEGGSNHINPATK